MSFILDALKKSENERQEQRPAEFTSVPSGTAAPRAPTWLWVLLLLLAVNVVVLLGLLMRDDTDIALDSVTGPVAQGQVTELQPTAEPSFTDRIEEARQQQPIIVARAETQTEQQAESVSDPQVQQPDPPVAVEPRESEFTLRVMPTAAQLRANGTLQMAELHLDIHVYSDAPEDRFVFINMVRHKESSRLAEGPVVREITPEGVILDYLGTEFLLPRE